LEWWTVRAVQHLGTLLSAASNSGDLRPSPKPAPLRKLNSRWRCCSWF
jgi:hypothetical protein